MDIREYVGVPDDCKVKNRSQSLTSFNIRTTEEWKMGKKTKNRGTLYTRLGVPHDHPGSSTRVLLGGRNELRKEWGGSELIAALIPSFFPPVPASITLVPSSTRVCPLTLEREQQTVFSHP